MRNRKAQNGKKGILKLLCMMVIGILAVLLVSCQNSENGKTEPNKERADWAIYWYLCGSDLESKHGAASLDLEEMMAVSLPEHVKVVIETGGSTAWQNKKIKEDELTRFLYDKNGLKKLSTQEVSNMGDANTFSEFLMYCSQYHPAEKTMVILWNHGGGVLGGVSYDEIYGLDSLSMTELHDSLTVAFEENGGVTYDLIGFDACLMANIDTAHAISPYASYMVASQELEPGNGWNYTGILKTIAENPQITPPELGVAICDTFMEGCRTYGTDAEATLSLIDLSEAEKLFETFADYGDSLFQQALEDDTVFASLGRAAKAAEGYGGNSKEEGYTNMVDMGGFVKAASKADEKMQTALDKSILYQVKGPYRAYGNGISCYYPLDNALSNLYQYKESSSLEGYENLYQYQLSGKLGTAVLEYLEKHDLTKSAEGKALITVDKLGLDNYPVMVTKEGNMLLEIGKKAEYLKQVSGYLAWVDLEQAKMIGIGNELVEDADWNNGRFSYPYRTKWWYLDGHLLYTFFQEDRVDYNLYSTPILLNGERVFLRIAEKTDGSGEILGARKELAENGMAEKELIRLQPGDEIRTLFYQSDMGSGDFNLGLKEYETFIVGEAPSLEKKDLMDGMYVWTYDMTDVWNNYATSSLVMYQVTDGVADGVR